MWSDQLGNRGHDNIEAGAEDNSTNTELISDGAPIETHSTENDQMDDDVDQADDEEEQAEAVYETSHMSESQPEERPKRNRCPNSKYPADVFDLSR